MQQVFTRTRVTATLMAAAFTIASCGGAAQPTGTTASTAAPAAAATTAPTAAAVVAPAPKGSLVLIVDTVSGSIGTTDEEKAMYSCVQKNRFPQGEPIVWRVKVYSTVTGKSMDNTALKSVVITFPDATTKDLKYGPHPKGKTDDYFWTTSFKIPADYPTGAFKYKLVATSLEGVTGTFDQFNVASSLLQVIKAGTR